MGNKVLIVDDAYFMRNLIKKVLKESGYDVVGEAKNGKEGISMYFELKPDIVTMDINMPDLSGIEATKQILSKDPHAKIVAVTGSDSDEIRDQMMAAGALEYLKKPFQPAFLLTKIEDMFKEKVVEEDSFAEENASIQPSPVTASAEVEEDFFENMEIVILDKPDESREHVLVIENNEDRIEFPEEDFEEDEKSKYALTEESSFEDQSFDDEVEDDFKEDIQEEVIQEETPIIPEPEKDEVEQLVDIQKPQAHEEEVQTRTVNDEVEVKEPVQTPAPQPTPTPPPVFPTPSSEEAPSYMQIRPPRGKVLSKVDYEPTADEQLVEPVINADGEITISSQKKGIKSLIASLFSKK